MVYYRERIHFKSTKGKAAWDKVQEKLEAFPPSEIAWVALNSPINDM